MSTSRAGDGGYCGCRFAEIAAELNIDYRLIGGNAVSLLAAIHDVTDLVPGRETARCRLRRRYAVVADPRLAKALAARGYAAVAGNRFTRVCSLPSIGVAAAASWDLAVDILTPSYRSHMLTS